MQKTLHLFYSPIHKTSIIATFFIDVDDTVLAFTLRPLNVQLIPPLFRQYCSLCSCLFQYKITAALSIANIYGLVLFIIKMHMFFISPTSIYI